MFDMLSQANNGLARDRAKDRLRRFRADTGAVQSRAVTVVSTAELYGQLEGADLSTKENVRHALQAVLAHVWRIEQRQTNANLRQRIEDV